MNVSALDANGNVLYERDFDVPMEQNRVEEARKIYEALLRMQPSVEDDERHSASKFMHYAEGRLIKASDKFRKRYQANEGINVPRISEGTNIPSKSVERHVKVLISNGMIEHRGSSLTDDDICQYLRGQWQLEHPTDLQKKEKADRNEIRIETILKAEC